ncbi:MAG: polyprenyl diphosphate synthase [Chloroflexota bacterium]
MAEALFPPGVKIPEHVAIIMDGNRRWADRRGIPRIQGHESGLENLHTIVGYLSDYKIKYASVFAFSTENWSRPREEIETLIGLLERRIDGVTRGFHQQDVRLIHLGGLERLTPKLVGSIQKAIALTRNNTGITLCLAFNYGGRDEIVMATRRIIKDGIPAERVDEALFSKCLYTSGLPDVDLLIRTGGELRISNFLIWQSAYAEYYFSELLWPDFDKAELDKALLAYSQRQRRFGRL